MSDSDSSIALLSIGAVERETGLTKDTLRVWERRYGFPQPMRDANGDRVYPLTQVERLRGIKRMVDNGFRPGRVIPQTSAGTLELPRVAPAPQLSASSDAQRFIELLKRHQLAEVRRALTQRLAKQGLQRFVHDTVAPFSAAVGEAWVRGDIAVFEEHLFSELTQNILRSALAGLHLAPRAPRVLLTTFPGEQHGLGLLMVEALLAIESADVVPLGPQTPITDILKAAQAHQADIVGLSFSAAYLPHLIGQGIGELRRRLPSNTTIWAGGAALSRVKQPISGLSVISRLADVGAAVSAWRERHA